MTANYNRITEFEEKTDMEILHHSNNFNGLETRVNAHIKDILDTRKRWLYEHPNENISQLYVPENQVQESELKDSFQPDSHQDFLKPISYDEARMYSLEQMQ